MDLLTAIVTLAPPLVGKVAEIVGDVWQDYRTGHQVRQGIAINPRGYSAEIPNISGVLSIPQSEFARLAVEEAPIVLTGRFVAEESFADFAEILLDEEPTQVIVLAVDEATEDIYFLEFDFDGYAIDLWPGYYSFYAFIVDPVLDEVLGAGYPYSEDLDDLNPIIISGEGFLEIDFFIFDIEDIE